MDKLHHPHVVRLFEVIETFSKIYLVMEYAHGGELYQKVHQEGRLSERVASYYFAQIISAIDHLVSSKLLLFLIHSGLIKSYFLITFCLASTRSGA